MNNPQIIGMLLGAISVLSSVIAFIYRDSSQRSREYADEWRTAFKEQQQVVEVNTKALEQVVVTVGSIQRSEGEASKAIEQLAVTAASIQHSEDEVVRMMRDLWYAAVRGVRAGDAPVLPPAPLPTQGGNTVSGAAVDQEGGPRNVR